MLCPSFFETDITFRIQEVEPDSEGNSFALYGCFAHQHPLTRIQKSEIVFENYKDALDFFEKRHKGMYRRRNCTSRAPGLNKQTSKAKG